MTLVEQLLREIIGKFNEKVAQDQELETELKDVRKMIQVEVQDGDWYHFVLENARVGEPQKGATESPDVRIIASSETLSKLWSKELRVMKAIATRKLQVKGSIEDLLRLKKFF